MLVDDGITPNIHVTKKYFAYFTRSHRPNCCRKLASKPEKNDSIRDVSCLNRCTISHFPGWHGVAQVVLSDQGNFL